MLQNLPFDPIALALSLFIAYVFLKILFDTSG